MAPRVVRHDPYLWALFAVSPVLLLGALWAWSEHINALAEAMRIAITVCVVLGCLRAVYVPISRGLAENAQRLDRIEKQMRPMRESDHAESYANGVARKLNPVS